MKWTFVIQQKAKAAALLFSVMVVTVLTALSMKHSMRDIDQTLTSVYLDRLQPAVAIIYLSDNLHTKRRLVQNALLTQPAPSVLKPQLSRLDADIQQLIGQFEKTKLVDGEDTRLRAFKAGMIEYARMEQNVLQLNASGEHAAAQAVFNQRGHALFQQGIQTLRELAKIQEDTGREVVKHAHREASGGYANATLLMAVAVVIGLLAQALIFDAKLMDQKPQPFHLN